MTPDEAATEVLNLWGVSLSGSYQRLRELMGLVIAKVQAEALEGGRREALASLSVPGAPMSNEQLWVFEEATKKILDRPNALDEFGQNFMADALRVVALARYLQGPILDALGHGELDQFKAGLDEGKRLRKVWVAERFVHQEGSDWFAVFDSEATAKRQAAEHAKENYNVTLGEFPWRWDEADGRFESDCGYFDYYVYETPVHGQ